MSYLIKNCQLLEQPDLMDVRLLGSHIADIGAALKERGGETLIDAQGGLLIPGLHDHHIHLVSLAASMASVHCGPPQVENQQQLAELLREQNQHHRQQWLRGIGYHTSVAGDIDRHWLDTVIPDRPVRIQHRGGRLWILNTHALEALGLLDDKPRSNLPKGVEYDGKWPSGRLYECDQWLRLQLNNGFPCLAATSRHLASQGITGITDTTPSNGVEEWDYFHKSQRDGSLLQKVRMMGNLNLPSHLGSHTLQPGEYKIHLLESKLPEMDLLIDQIRQAHKQARNVAIHCVTHTELVFAIACLESANVMPGDRIEHASVTTPDMLEKLADLGLRVVSQPHFIYERGEQYLREVDRCDQPWLYRLHSFIEAGVPLAAGSDAPFGAAAPWLSMQCAVSRQTMDGRSILPQEALTPEMALQLYTSQADSPGVTQREVNTGNDADLCLLKAPWETLKQDLAKAEVAATWIDGRLIYRP